MTFHSQCGEDKWILENLISPGHDLGTFCEVGAYDGVLSSNTKVFEDLGWTGILVEADPHLAALCWRNRKARTWCCAAGLETNGILYVDFADRGLSGFQVVGAPMDVLVKRLDWLLAASRIEQLDLLSIDTEGTELEVWESLGIFRPSIAIIEYQTTHHTPKDGEIISRLTRDGYKEVHRTQYNLIFSNSDLRLGVGSHTSQPTGQSNEK